MTTTERTTEAQASKLAQARANERGIAQSIKCRRDEWTVSDYQVGDGSLTSFKGLVEPMGLDDDMNEGEVN